MEDKRAARKAAVATDSPIFMSALTAQQRINESEDGKEHVELFHSDPSSTFTTHLSS